MNVVKEVLDYLNANPAQLTALAAVLAVALQYGVNKVKPLGEFTNYALALVALPGFATGVIAYSTSIHLTAYPWVVVVGQVLYATLEAYKDRVIAKATLPTQQDIEQSFTEAAAQVPAPTVSEY